MNKKQAAILRKAFQDKYGGAMEVLAEQYKEDYYIIYAARGLASGWTVRAGFCFNSPKIKITKEEYDILKQIL